LFARGLLVVSASSAVKMRGATSERHMQVCVFVLARLVEN